MKRFTVDKEIDLKSFIAEKLNISKKKAKEIIDSKNVFVNDKRIWIATHRLKKGDKVEVNIKEANSENIKNRIIYEDKYIIAVSKPPFVDSNQSKNSVENQLRELKKDKNIEAIHRLDRETSGVLLFAKNRDIFEKFKDNWNEITDKKYLAIIHGNPKFSKKVIDSPIENKRAISEVRKLSTNGEFSLVEIKIPTGRKHQIRIHLAREGYPIVGDKIYGLKRIDNRLIKNITRHMLHSREIELFHPFLKKKIRIKAPLERDFKELKEKLKL